MSPFTRFLWPARSLRALRSATACVRCGDFGDALLGIGKVVLRRRQLQRLALAIVAPVAAVPRGAEAGELDDRVHACRAARGRG